MQAGENGSNRQFPNSQVILNNFGQQFRVYISLFSTADVYVHTDTTQTLPGTHVDTQTSTRSQKLAVADE